MGREQIEALKYQVLLPYRKKNAALGLGLLAMIGGICRF